MWPDPGGSLLVQFFLALRVDKNEIARPARFACPRLIALRVKQLREPCFVSRQGRSRARSDRTDGARACRASYQRDRPAAPLREWAPRLARKGAWVLQRCRYGCSKSVFSKCNRADKATGEEKSDFAKRTHRSLELVSSGWVQNRDAGTGRVQGLSWPASPTEK